MTWALRFHIDRDGVNYWIHGRDMPGYPASHGCVGLYDEAMQKKYYKVPRTPEMRTRGNSSSGHIPPRGRREVPLPEGGAVVRIVGGTPGKNPGMTRTPFGADRSIPERRHAARGFTQLFDACCLASHRNPLQFEPVAVVVLRGMAHQHFEAFIYRGERGVRYFR